VAEVSAISVDEVAAILTLLDEVTAAEHCCKHTVLVFAEGLERGFEVDAADGEPHDFGELGFVV